MTEEFKIGDVVEAFGVRGRVTGRFKGDTPVACNFDDVSGWVFFNEDGRLHNWHKTPSLKLIRRKKEPFKWEGKVTAHWIDCDCGGRWFTIGGLTRAEPFPPEGMASKKGTLTFVEGVE